MNRGCATGHPSLVTTYGFTNLCLAQLDLWKNRATNKVGVYRLPNHRDEEIARRRLAHSGTLTD